MSAGIEHLQSLGPSHIKMGLGRVEAALKLLGDPQKKIKAVHVAGTNGKGSTCAFIESCLRKKYRTGLYTSPHLETINERIKVNGINISDDLFDQRIQEVLAVLKFNHELTFFEFSTVVAFWHFAHENIDIVVIETGLGGRLDATTACIPLVTCLTPIGFDHMEYLGNSLDSITREKCGIMKPGISVVSAKQVDVAGAVIALAARELNCPLIEVVEAELRPLSLIGDHQKENAALAVACLKQLSLHGFALSETDITLGLANTNWPGRLELVLGIQDILLDGAHNEHGVVTLLAALNSTFQSRKVHLVFGVFRDKAFSGMMEKLIPRCESVALVKLQSERSADVAQLNRLALPLCRIVSMHQSVEEGIAVARSRCQSSDLIVVAGSLTLVAQARNLLGLTVEH